MGAVVIRFYMDTKNEKLEIIKNERNRHDVDLLIIKLEKINHDFYESLIKFISDHGYKPKVIVHNTDSLSINGLKIISSKRQLFRDKEEISMTNKEFGILELLVRNKGQVFSKEQIYDQVWGESYFSDNRNIIAYINKIRKKIEPDPVHPIYILTVWGIGYKFNEQIE